MVYCATRSVGQGKAAGVVSALGIGGGGLVHTAMAALGLSAILMYSSTAFQVIKLAGAAYLVYIGVRMIVGKRKATATNKLPDAGLLRIFRQGVVTNVLNPKVALFFLSFLPQFVHPERGSVAVQIIVLGMIFNFTGTTVNVLVGLLFGYVGGWLETKPAFWKVQRWVTGSIFVALGASLALPDRR
ncbi:MAG: LysE family translocator [bacterium]|nr:LysE family translocator [bacterium]